MAPVAARSSRRIVDQATRPSGAALEPRRGPARSGGAARRAWCGRGGARCPTGARRPRPARLRPRGCAASRWGARTSTCPSRSRPSARPRSAPSARSSGWPSADGEQRDHLAGRRGAGSIQSACPPRRWRRGGRSSAAAGSRTGPGAGGRRRLPAPPSRSRRARAGRRRRRARDPCGTGRSPAGSRTAAARDRCTPAVARPPSASTRWQTPSTAPSVSASGFSWLTARTWRAPRSRARTASGTASRAHADRSIGRRPRSSLVAPRRAARRPWAAPRGRTGCPPGPRRLDGRPPAAS